jgi:hypothetical protein
MTGPLPVQPAAVAAALAALTTTLHEQMPVVDVAHQAASAWRRAHRDQPHAGRRLDAGTVAVVDAIYPLGFAAGRAASAAAVATHITAAAAQAITTLDLHDPGAVIVRGLLGRLTIAAADEVRRSCAATTPDQAGPAWPRSYLEARGGFLGGPDPERVAHAASIAWTHGLEDGWTEGHWAANRIVNTVRHDVRAATTMLDGTPTFVWLDDLAAAARDISRDKPPGHPARLARLAGAEPAPDTVAPRSSLPDGAADDTIDKHHRQSRGM